MSGLKHKTNQKALAKTECEKFAMALQSKTKWQVYRKLKWERGFEEYLENLKESRSRLFLKFHSGTHGLFEEYDGHYKGVRSHECSNCEAC